MFKSVTRRNIITLMKSYQKFFNIFKIVYIFLTFCVISITVVDFIVYLQTKNFIVQSRSIPSLKIKKKYAIVLGASVRGEKLSHVLQDRMETAIEMYHKGLVEYMLLSGDGVEKHYNETSAMKKFALRHGVPQDVIMIDNSGFNTYTSLLHSKKIYNIHDAYIISQAFHVGRAVWIARGMDIDAMGVSVGNIKILHYDTLREIFARAKDFFRILFYRSTH